MRNRFLIPTARRSLAVLLVAISLLAAPGCGSKGGLYLPPSDDASRQGDRK
jgi:predicted small lipoprotein YifL